MSAGDPPRSSRPASARPGPAAAILALAVVALLAVHRPLPAAVSESSEHLNLFQRVARADLVVHVRVAEGALRFAVVAVLETLKGTSPPAHLRVAFRESNLRRPPGAAPIVFRDGEEAILFLGKGGRGKNADVHPLLNGEDGVVPLPAEGARGVLDAVRRLVVVANADPASQVERLVGLAADPMPETCAAALDELERLRATPPALRTPLVRLLEHRDPAIRRRAVRLAKLLFADAADPGTPADDARAILDSVIDRARADPDESVRVDAVVALAAWPERAEVEPDLKAIAAADPAQAVRFEAERALFIRR